MSLTLVLGVVAVPFYYSIVALTKPETVAMVIQGVDYKRVIQKNPDIKDTLSVYDITPAEADAIMKSKETGELVEIYADEATRIFLNIPNEQKLDASYIKKLVKENTDKFLDITEDNTDVKFNREVVEKEVETFLKENKGAIEESAATLEEVRNVVKTIYASRVIKNHISLGIAIGFIMVMFIIIAIIIVIMRSNGFFWVGADFTVINILLGLIILFGKSKLIGKIALKMSDFGTQIVDSAISISMEKMTVALLGTMILMVLFILFFVTIKLLKRKYQYKEVNNIDVNVVQTDNG